MKRATVLVPAIVALVFAFGWLARRWSGAERGALAIERPRLGHLAPLTPPHGSTVLRGRVVDIDGEPVASVSIYARTASAPAWVVTDADGRFELAGLAEGAVEVVVVAPGFPPQSETVEAPSGEVEIQLFPRSPPPPHLEAIERAPFYGRVAHPIGGRWMDPEGYEVVLEPRDPPNVLGGAVPRRARSDARGFFELDDLALASYRVRALPAWASGGSWPDLAAADSSVVEHAAGGTAAFELGLACGAIEGVVESDEGERIEGAFVLLWDAASPARVWPPESTDPFGRFRFLDLPPGPYRLEVRAGEGAIEDFAVEVASGAVARPALPAIAVRR